VRLARVGEGAVRVEGAEQLSPASPERLDELRQLLELHVEGGGQRAAAARGDEVGGANDVEVRRTHLDGNAASALRTGEQLLEDEQVPASAGALAGNVLAQNDGKSRRWIKAIAIILGGNGVEEGVPKEIPPDADPKHGRGQCDKLKILCLHSLVVREAEDRDTLSRAKGGPRRGVHLVDEARCAVEGLAGLGGQPVDPAWYRRHDPRRRPQPLRNQRGLAG